MYVEVKSTKLYYTMEGTGIPCMFINYTGTVFHERTISKELHEYFHLITVDLRGGGQSDPGIIEEITLASLLEDLEQLRQTLNLNTMAVMGHSANVLLALEYARQYPMNTSRVIIWGLGPKWGAEDSVKKRQEYWEAHASEKRKATLKRNLEQLTDEGIKDTLVQPTNKAWIKWYVANGPLFWHEPKFDCSHLFKDTYYNMDVLNWIFEVVLKDYDATQFLSQITCPVFLAMGKYDFANPPTLWDGEKEKFPHRTYHLFERSGHHPHFEEQALFTKKLIAWIQEH